MNNRIIVGAQAVSLDESDYVAKLSATGFTAISIEPTRLYDVEDAREFLTGKGIDIDALAPLLRGKFFSGFVRATKPGECAETPTRCCGRTQSLSARQCEQRSDEQSDAVHAALDCFASLAMTSVTGCRRNPRGTSPPVCSASPTPA